MPDERILGTNGAEPGDEGNAAEVNGGRARAWRRFAANRAAVVGLLAVVLLILVAIGAPLLAPYSPVALLPGGLSKLGGPVAPSAHFLLGTDELGRDVLSRLLYGLRVSLEVGLTATAVNVVVGTAVGITAAMGGRWVEQILMRLTDVMLAFPFLLFVILVVAILHPGLIVLYMVIGLLGWAPAARIVRGQALSTLQEDFIGAARALGASPLGIAWRHLLPNVLMPVVAFAALQVGNYVLLEGALSYLGAGAPPPTPSLGAMIYEGQKYFQSAPWLMLFPGVLMTVIVLAFNLVGDGLTDVLAINAPGRR